MLRRTHLRGLSLPLPPNRTPGSGQVLNQEKVSGGELRLDQRRQILADILVWAEVTQSRYDSDTAS